MRKLSVLLTLLLVALCTHVSHAWNFWTGSDIYSIAFYDTKGNQSYVMETGSSDDGSKMWYTEFTPSQSEITWKWTVKYQSTTDELVYGRGMEYSLGTDWTDMAIKYDGDNTLKNLDTNKKYRIEIKGKSQTYNSIPQGRIFLVEEGSSGIPEGLYREDGVFTIYYEGTSAPKIWIWNTSTDKGELYNGNLGYADRPTMDAVKGFPGVYKFTYSGTETYPNRVKFDEGSEYEVSGNGMYFKNGKFLDETVPVKPNDVTYTITVGNTSAYNGFTFGNLKVLVGSNWEDTTDGKYTGATAPTAFKYETVTLPAGGYAENFKWEGELSGTDSELSGNLNTLYTADFKFQDNANNTFGEPNVKVVSNGIELVAMNVTATRVANEYDYTVMTNRTSLDGAQVSFTSKNPGHAEVSGPLTDVTFTAGERQVEQRTISLIGQQYGNWAKPSDMVFSVDPANPYRYTLHLDELQNGEHGVKIYEQVNGTATELAYDGNPTISGDYKGELTAQGSGNNINISGTLTNVNLIYTFDESGKRYLEIKTVKDYTAVNMPLKQSDFAADGSKKHYFIVGSRMGGWRLQPEWELTVNGTTASLKDPRLIYPGTFAIGMVDNYDDYINQKYTIYSAQAAWVTKGSKTATLKADGTAEGIIYNTIKAESDDGKWGFHIDAEKVKTGGHCVMYFDWDNRANLAETDENVKKEFEAWKAGPGSGSVDEGDDRITRVRYAIQACNPALVNTFNVTLNESGAPTALEVDAISPLENRRAVIDELNFTFVGTNVRNMREVDGVKVFDAAKTPLNKSGVTQWGATWIQYDPETKMPYVDGRGEYIYQTVYQSNWLEKHPTYFYRKAEEMEYDSNSLRLRSLSEIEESVNARAEEDEYLPYYRAMRKLAMGDGVLKSSGNDPSLIANWNYKDQMAVATNPAVSAPENEEGWIPFIASDVYFGGVFKLWTGFGGGHLGYGTWNTGIDGGSLYMWNSINAGGSQAEVNTPVTAHNINVPEGKEDLAANKVTVYTTKRDVNGANFQISEVDDNGNAPMQYYKRVILWYNPELGIDHSVLQFILGDYEARIQAVHSKSDAKTARYAWSTRRDEAVNADNVKWYMVERIRNGETESAEQVYYKEYAEGKYPTFMSFAGNGDTYTDDPNLQPGTYTYRLTIELENAGTRRVTSNPVTIYEAGQPVELMAKQHQEEGNVAFQIDANMKIKSSVINFNSSDLFADGETLGQHITSIDVVYSEEGSDETHLLTLPYKHYDADNGVTMKFAAEPGKTYNISANIVVEEAYQNLLELLPATGKVTVNYPELTISDVTVNAIGEEVTEGYYSELAEGEKHHGHSTDHPVNYQKVNNLRAAATVSHNWVAGDCEGTSDKAVLTLEYNGMSAEIEAGKLTANYLPVPAAEGEMLFKVKARYTRNGSVLGEEKSAVSEGVTPDMTLDNICEYFISENDVKVVTDGVHGNGGGNNEWNKVNMYDLYVPFTYSDSESTVDLYTSYGFEVSDYRNYSDGHEDSGDWMQGATPHAVEPYIWPNNGLGLTGGADGYTLYDGSNWTSANDWGHLMGKGSQFAIMLDHIDCDYGGTPGVTVKKEVVAWNDITFTIHKYYPFVVANELKVEPTNVQAAPAMYAAPRAAMPDAYVTLVQPATASAQAVLPAGSKSVSSGIITGVENVSVDANLPVDVYTVGGALIMRRTSKAEALKTLAPGIYMIGGEKVVVK